MRLNRPSPRRSGMIGAALLLAAGAAVAGTGLASAATAGCQVTYAVSSQWPGGFGANVTVTNLGDPVTGWTLSWNDAGTGLLAV